MTILKDEVPAYSHLWRDYDSDLRLACRGQKRSRYCRINPAPGMQQSFDPSPFVTTRWSLILSGAQFESGEQQAREALTELCRTYWRPIFSFVCHRGHAPEDAQDLTQDFFVMILESNWLRQADESRGRFRSFLLKSLQNFLGHAAERKRARKRGGDLDFVSSG